MKKIVVIIGLILSACSPKNEQSQNFETKTEALATFEDTSTALADFGNPVTASTTRIFTFKNIGDSTGPGTATLTGTNATSFSIILQTGCATVNVGSTCTVRVNFNPAGKSPSTYNAILSVGGTTKALSAIVGSGSTSGGGSGTIEATISDVIIDNPLDFGTFSGTQTSTKTIKLTNKGTSSIGPLSAILSDTDFSFLINSCVGKTLAPNTFCSVRVSFNATGKMIQEYLTDLTFGTSSFPLKATVSSGGSTTGGTTGGASNLTILEGLSPITTPVDYGTLTGSQSLIKIFTIKNTGTSNIIVNPTLNNTNFTMILNSCSNKNLLPNGSCSIRVGFAAKNKIDQEYLSTITVVTGSTIELKAIVSGSQGGGIVYTYDPVFSSWGTCSANQACEGVGSQTRTITQCNRFQDGNPAGVGTLADCANFNIPLNTIQSCNSPQGNVTLPILGGEQVFSCPVGSTVQTFESVSCNSGYHINGQVCEADPNMYSLTIQNGTSATITDGSSIFCDGTCPSQTVSYQENTLVNLQVTYPSNYRFLGWTGDCSSSGANAVCSLTMDSSKTVGVSLELINPPVLNSISINNGDNYTNSSSVSLEIDAVDAEEMKISQTTDCSSGEWVSFSSSVLENLSSLNQSASVSVITRNAGGESSCVSDSIIHDDVSPVVMFDHSEDQVVPVGSYIFGFSINEVNPSAFVEIEEYSQLDCTGPFVATNSSSNNYSITLNSGESKSIKIKAQDLAGNLTEGCSYNVIDQGSIQNTLSVQLDGDGNFITTVTDDLSLLSQVGPRLYSGSYDDQVVTLTPQIGATDVFMGWSNSCGMTMSCQVDMSTGSKNITLNLAQRTKDLSQVYYHHPLKSHSVTDTIVDPLWVKSADFKLPEQVYVSYKDDTKQLVTIGNTVYFAGPDNNNVLALWKTEGTPETTVKLTERLDLWGTAMEVLNGKIYFFAKTAASGMELFYFDPLDSVDEANVGVIPLCSNGYNPCVIKDLNPGVGNGIPFLVSTKFIRSRNIQVYNNKIIYTGWEGQADPVTATDYLTSMWVFDPNLSLNYSTTVCSSGGNPCRLTTFTTTSSMLTNNFVGPEITYRENGRMIFYLRKNGSIGNYVTFITNGTTAGSYTILGRTVSWLNVVGSSSSDAPPVFIALRGDYAYVKHYGALSIIRLSTGQLTEPFGSSLTTSGLCINMAASNEISGDSRVLILAGCTGPTNTNSGTDPAVKWALFNGTSMSILPVGATFDFTSYDSSANGGRADVQAVNLSALTNPDPNKMYIYTSWRIAAYTYSPASGVWQYNQNAGILSTANDYCTEGANPCKVYNNGNTSNPTPSTSSSFITMGDLTYYYNDLRQLPITGSNMTGLYLYSIQTPTGPSFIGKYSDIIPNSEEMMNFCVLKNGSDQLVTVFNESRVDQVLALLNHSNSSDFQQDCNLIADLLEDNNNYNTTFVASGKPIAGVVNTAITGTVEQHLVKIGHEVRQVFQANGHSVAIVSKRVLIYESGIISYCLPWASDCQINDFLGSKIVSFIDNGTYAIPAPDVLSFTTSQTVTRTTGTFNITATKNSNIIIRVTTLINGSVSLYPSTGPTPLGTSHQIDISDLVANTLYEFRIIGTTPDGDFYMTTLAMRTRR